jgi:hypothetical protein
MKTDLERLEDRLAPAATPLAPVPPEFGALTVPVAEDLNTSAVTASLVFSDVRVAFAQGAAFAAVPAPVGATGDQAGATAPSFIDQSVYGFQGRVLFPGTGMEVRTATQAGPLSQPPGRFLEGGRAEVTEAPEAYTPAPSEGTEAEGGVPGGRVEETGPAGHARPSGA